jgi:hypothetical protein
LYLYPCVNFECVLKEKRNYLLFTGCPNHVVQNELS